MIQNPFANMTQVVKNLLIINIIFFIATYALGAIGFDMVRWLSAFYPNSPFFRMWQIISYMFMHGSLWHILSNMIGLIMIGPLLEYTLGSKRFLMYYFITGIGALALQFAVQAFEVHQITGSFMIDINNYQVNSVADLRKLQDIYLTPILGASGAIFGLLVAVYLLYPDVEVYIYFIPIPVKMKYLVPVYVLFELYSGFSQSPGDSVAHFAHLGGALIGFIVIKIWGVHKPNNFF
jgi:membrane associated rhomboid family serine protease